MAPLTDVERSALGPLVEAVIELDQRVNPHGAVLQELVASSFHARRVVRAASKPELADRQQAAVRAAAEVIRDQVEVEGCLRAELESARASRFAWAEEAGRLDAHVQELHTDLAAAVVDARATNELLALTEQPEPSQRESSLAQRIAAQCTCEYPYPREVWAGHHPNCETEQQPASDGTSYVTNMTCPHCGKWIVVGGRVVVRQQPEPVSESELAGIIAFAVDLGAADNNDLAHDLLSRYTITRKQPEGANHVV